MTEALTDRELNLWIARNVTAFPELLATSVNYCTDRNACAHAEAKIADMYLGSAYVEALTPAGMGGRFDAICATARQRCEAMYAIREHITQCKEDRNA